VSSARRRLVARTTALPEPSDLLAEAGDRGLLWRDEHGGLAGAGVAARIELPGGLAQADSARRVSEALESIETADEVGLPGCGPVAIGSLPFDPAAPGHLVIPQRLVGRSGQQGWETKISEAGKEPSEPGRNPVEGPGEPPDQFTLVSSMPHPEWKEMVAAAVADLSNGDFHKVVLARRIDISANRPFIVSDVLERLVALYPSCMVFSVDGFLGASPELLISRVRDRVESHPLAGTVARSGDAHGDEALVAKLMGSSKARREHQVVVDAVAEALSPVCDELIVPGRPSIVGLRNVSHLGTHICGHLSARGAGGRPSALQLVARVHPTPAVGGTPTEAAVRYLQKVEGFDRRCYAGPVGWMDYRGDGAWAIGIRCAEVDGASAHLYAGNGIVAGSDPAEELAETQLKLQALLAALVRP
jgi:menaquinone-specific isochorismate synthase